MFASNQGYGQQTSQQAQQTPEFDEDSIIDSLGRGGGKAFFNADSQPGATITGTVAEVHAYQAKDFQTGELQYSKSGKPKYDMVINLIDTDAPREDQYDEGARSIYIHGWGGQLDAYVWPCARPASTARSPATACAPPTRDSASPSHAV